MSEKLPDDIMDFDELRGYIWAWLSRTVTHKEDFKSEESKDYYFDWFIDKVNELEGRK